MSIEFIVEAVIKDKKKPFTEEQIFNDNRLRSFPNRRTIIHSVISKFIYDKIISVENYSEYKINTKR
jgi:hypothetical protein